MNHSVFGLFTFKDCFDWEVALLHQLQVLAVRSEFLPHFKKFALDLTARFERFLNNLNLFVFVLEPVVHLSEGIDLRLNSVKFVA